MIPEDLAYIRRCLERGVLQSPCLELGAGYEGETCRELLQSSGLRYFATDRVAGPRVDYVLDFESPAEVLAASLGGQRFGSVLCLNVLEHTFEPLQVLDNIFSLLVAGGTCVVVAPAVWPLHDYPMDCYRLNPNFYEQYARRRGVHLEEQLFEYVGRGKVRDFQDGAGRYALPPPTPSLLKGLRSKVVHRLFDTSGRGMFFPSQVGIGCVLRKPAAG